MTFTDFHNRPACGNWRHKFSQTCTSCYGSGRANDCHRCVLHLDQVWARL